MPRRSLSPDQKTAVRAKYSNRCPGLPHLGIACGKALPTNSDAVFDHIDQVSLSGNNDITNFQPLCIGRGSCNDIKTNGLGGTRRVTTAGSDANLRAKVRRITGKNKPKRKHQWPSRKIANRSRFR